MSPGTEHTMNIFLLVVDLLGTIAFAVSGALVGLKKKMDVFGVCTLGLTTAVGGGIIRDLIIGNTPPVTFRDPTYATTALVISLVLFIFCRNRIVIENSRTYNCILFWIDTLGLGAFTVAGIEAGYEHTEDPSLFLLVFLAVITGVGGGILRDLLAGDTPFIFIKHIYACASLIGAVVCVMLHSVTIGGASVVSTVACIGTVAIVRGLAAHYHWNLPRSHVK